jgi:hypothetical protein
MSSAVCFSVVTPAKAGVHVPEAGGYGPRPPIGAKIGRKSSQADDLSVVIPTKVGAHIPETCDERPLILPTHTDILHYGPQTEDSGIWTPTFVGVTIERSLAPKEPYVNAYGLSPG